MTVNNMRCIASIFCNQAYASSVSLKIKRLNHQWKLPANFTRQPLTPPPHHVFLRPFKLKPPPYHAALRAVANPQH